MTTRCQRIRRCSRLEALVSAVLVLFLICCMTFRGCFAAEQLTIVLNVRAAGGAPGTVAGSIGVQDGKFEGFLKQQSGLRVYVSGTLLGDQISIGGTIKAQYATQATGFGKFKGPIQGGEFVQNFSTKGGDNGDFDCLLVVARGWDAGSSVVSQGSSGDTEQRPPNSVVAGEAGVPTLAIEPIGRTYVAVQAATVREKCGCGAQSRRRRSGIWQAHRKRLVLDRPEWRSTTTGLCHR